ncbi:dTDP-4-dehydrorhamnose 3,5-epimerase family protein [Candidatus Gottesmanbacteria bacterium]|nr:dTDP-4-dehydrorhamnose 3,5-epimerase family protein [Candidatus Gottesmanbacteria bacterium]
MKYPAPSSQTLIEGVKVKNLTRNYDERGFFEELIRVTDEFFKEGFGQLSHSFMKEGVTKAWHIHKTQTDWWYVAKGSLWVALCDMRKVSKTYLRINEFVLGEDGEDIILKIPPGVAHGCKVLTPTSELFYVTSGVYSTQEEGRIDHDDPTIGYDWLQQLPRKS